MASLDWRPARVRAVEVLSPDIRAIDILPEGAFAPPAPGAHLQVEVRIGDRPDQRSYSIFAASPEGGYRIAVKRLASSRGGSRYMSGLEPGARLSIAGPGNHFPLTSGAREPLLIAGGIGITPIFSHAAALARSQGRFRVLYAAHSRQDLALATELAAMVGDRLTLHVGEEGGQIDLAAEFARLPADGEAYICGPIRMLEAAKLAWAQAGRPMDRLRFETFGASGAWPTTPFLVKIPRLGREIEVPDTQTMLEALEAAGVEMIYDCRRGECGLCALTIQSVDGVIDHRDVFFSAAEKAECAKLCACVSRVYGASVTVDTADR
jgi:ferredoxin-NADP reductase